MAKKPPRSNPVPGPADDPRFDPTSKENLEKASPEELQVLAAMLPPNPAPEAPPVARGAAPRERSPVAERSWEKAHEAVGKHRAKLRRRTGVVGVHVTPELDELRQPTGKAAITIEVEEKIPKEALRKNRILPESLEGVPVKVADIRGHTLLGDVEEYRRAHAAEIRPKGLALPEGSPRRAAAPAAGTPVRVGPGIPIVPVDAAGGQLGGWGTVSALVLVYNAGTVPNPQPFFLTCSHVLAGPSGALDQVRVGCLNQPSIGLPPVGAAVSFDEGRGHDSTHDCVIITPNAAAVAANDIQVIYLIAAPPNTDPPQYIGTPAGQQGHYVARRLTDADVRAGTQVFHLGARTGGREFGTVVGVDGDFDGRNTPIRFHLITIQGPSTSPFVEGGDSGGLLMTKEHNEVVGMIVGLRDDGKAVACHFLDVISFFAGTSRPVDL